MQAWIAVGVVTGGAWALAYFRAPGWLWTVTAAAGIAFSWCCTATPPVMLVLAGIIVAILALVLNPGPIRRAALSGSLLALFRTILPHMSNTEKEAIDAGTVWWDGELFSGRPDWKKLLAVPKPALNAEEQAFLDGPVEALCAMVNEWEVTHERHDLSPETWQFIKAQGFLGMIIPRAYGGKGFSALMHSSVIAKLTTHSSTAAVSVMVPNSLGPAELLLHYGTREQKDYYLPRLAQGLEMPCFALTSPEAGSDAGGIPDFGVVCKGEWQGTSGVLGIRLSWEKRYITLGPVATLLGLAFRLFDPDHLLGQQEDIGITLALIPTATPGVHIGRRHSPLDGAFMNGPNWGHDVFVPMAFVIGGADYVGQGWKMLMNCLAAGRSISLPASSVGMAKLAARTTGAYGRVRSQFNLSIGRFEGVEEAMARIGGNLYLMEAARLMTAGALDLGEKPSVISAIMKYHITERGRQVINDAMDVHGGKGICIGPSNYLGRPYQQIPVAITVEGANILTRSMIIYGQGAIRGHPFVLKEMAATQEVDPHKALNDFDRAFFGHIAFAVSNKARAAWMGLTGARLVLAPGDRETRRYYQQITRLSSAFAWVSDVSMFVLGGSLKRRERLSARLGDILSQLYLASTVLKHYADDGRPPEDRPLLHWAMRDALYRAQEAFYGLFENMPNRLVAWVLRLAVFPWGRAFDPPADRLGSAVVGLLMTPGEARDRLTRGMYLPRDPTNPVAIVDAALLAVIAAEPAEAKLKAAQRAGTISGEFPALLRADGLAKGVISGEEADSLTHAAELRRKAIMVDDFPKDFGRSEMTQTTQPVSFAALQR